jgi:hypothetical protein
MKGSSSHLLLPQEIEFFTKNAANITKEVSVGVSKKRIEKDYHTTRQGVEISLFLMGRGDLMYRSTTLDYAKYNTLKQLMFKPKPLAPKVGNPVAQDQIRTLIQELTAKRWSNDDIKRILLVATGKKAGWTNDDAPAVRRTMDFAHYLTKAYELIKAESPDLTLAFGVIAREFKLDSSEVRYIMASYQELLNHVRRSSK